jgi:hypothetical protein
VSKIFKKSYTRTLRRQITQLKPKNLNRHFSKQDIQTAKEHIERCPISLAIWEKKMKTIM